ncbi:hypothetical protein ACFO1B_21515 [Dactylosporangium siamense]|uniref:Uncharacterized protein n=1 Tax=Dactylosporangium siamense TaxID=685454 RepID=A0A919PYC4_9ACTN|nr:hypothetical protein [Dactylosporangium siamense]GIG50778.1 hypothetical protein Dsi01nite_088190 [Dactylosporangium siamense]
MTWAALVSAAVGAALALSGSLLVEVRRDRRQAFRERQASRRQASVDFVLALGGALNALRDAARSGADPQTLARDTTSAVGDSGLYAAREHILMSGTPALVTAAEVAFHALIDVRNAVRSGAALTSEAYHTAYHRHSETMWQFRLAVRADLGERGLTPSVVQQRDWSDRDRCRSCDEPAPASS